MTSPANCILLPSGSILVLAAAPRLHLQTAAPAASQQEPPIRTPSKPAGDGKAQVAPPSVEGGETSAPVQQPPAQPRGGQQDCYMQLLFIVPVLLIMYFLMIRPQQKEQKKRQAMLVALKKGDQIVTTGGIHGQVAAVEEQTVVVKFGSSDGQRFKIDRSAVARVVEQKAESKPDKDAGKNGEG
jgi:preprotein translocase subunit YajC